MKVKLFATLLLVLFFLVSETDFCKSELEWVTTYNIEVGENGSARWIIERKTLLESEYDKATFDYFSSTEYHYELSKNISELVKTARGKTGRWNMTFDTRSLKIASTYAVTYGVITYQYEWIGFANLVPDQERIEVGDAFVDGVFLFGNGELSIEYPSEYVVAGVFPDPDDTRKSDRTIIWHELQSFGAEEPMIILRKKGLIDVLHEYMLLIGSVVTAVSVGLAGLWIFRFRKKNKAKAVGPTARPTLETEDDEERVVRLLKDSHGSLYQVTITERCGFSKTKTSLLLAAMEKKGIVKRKKKGRKKLVTLVENMSAQPKTIEEP